MGKLKIRVKESNGTLLDSFDDLASLLKSAGYNLTGQFSLRDSVYNIQNGGKQLDTPKAVKAQLLKKREHIEAAFDKVFSELDAYL